jgi:virginiamycin B lyase
MDKLISLLFVLFLLMPVWESETETQKKNEAAVYDVGVSITEWRVPWDGRPRDPYVAPNGTIYFVGQRTHYVGHFNPETEEFSRFDLEDGAGPHTVVVDDNGTPWYTGNRANHIGKVDPETGEITKYMMPDDMSARDPHTIAFNEDGNMWFTSQGANSVGFFNVNTGEPEIIPVPTERARPYGIVMANDGEQPWFTLFGTNKLGTVNPETMELTEVELPREEIRARRLAITSDGRVWYGDYATGYVGVYDPVDDSHQEWAMPEGREARPYAVTVDDQDRFWLVASGTSPNRFVGFDTNTEEFIESEPIESGGGTVRHMVFHEPTNSIWFGTDTNYLGRATINE